MTAYVEEEGGTGGCVYCTAHTVDWHTVAPCGTVPYRSRFRQQLSSKVVQLQPSAGTMATLQELIHCIRPFRPIHRPVSFLRPCLAARPQLRCASILTELSDPASAKKPIRRGRGASSGKGKTSGRGHKGQGQRGKVPHGFEGGQTPLYILKGKRGFDNMYVSGLQPWWCSSGTTMMRACGSSGIARREFVRSSCR